MLSGIARKWFWDNRLSVGVWSAGVSAVGAMYASLWPTMNDPGIQELLEAYPETMIDAFNFDDIATPEGYLGASVYGLLAAVLTLIAAASGGARSIAGDEESGSLELLVTHPVSRVQFALRRFAGVAATVVAIVVVFFMVIVALRPVADLTRIPVGHFVAMHFQLLCFGLFFGALAFAIGAATGRRAWALGAVAIVGVLSFLADGLLASVEQFAWAEALSPFDWLVGENPLRSGASWGDIVKLVVGTVCFVAAGVWQFERRDLAA